MAAIALHAFGVAAFGQHLSFGVVGGTNLTGNFPVTEFYTPADAFGNYASLFRYQTGSRSFILGASVGVRLTDRFAIEGKVLHRPMKAQILFTGFLPNGSRRLETNKFTAVRAWEFPILFKYTPAMSVFGGRLRPFIAAGPSFRTQEDAGATEPSQIGISAGAGAAFRLGRFQIAPTLRYTRWAKESIYPKYATKPDQLEFLTSFSYETEPGSRRLAGRTVEIGAIAGFALTRAFPRDGYGGVRDERIGYLAGLTVQMALVKNLAIEVDAIYKPLRAAGTNPDRRTAFSVLTWQFPILAKYALSQSKWAPFVEAGPSFRLYGNHNGYNPSRYGATIGAGVEGRVGHGVRLAPALRYTRWAADKTRFPELPGATFAYPHTKPNSVELVLGISF